MPSPPSAQMLTTARLPCGRALFDPPDLPLAGHLFDREEDGRWIALVESLPGCHVYGQTRQEALTKVEALALHAIAEKLEDGEVTAEEATKVSFVVSAAA